ncbi:apolipoprotein L3-like [Suricata suricatta]|uniref:Apolipoprotein L3 n=1 Tax=Suricata suricatta TaxID=37032 RepID=A0A673V570_SURSU|nr:apolipoprotein L3-like [Suricata suricatta]
MAQEAPECTSFIEDTIEYFWNSETWDELDLLLTDQEAWESFVAEADLPREESEVLLERLRVLEEELITEDINWLQSDSQGRKCFLNEFPGLKQELEEQIRKLREFADGADEVHRNCTIANIVASSTGAASGILTLLGCVLAPLMAGASLALTATGVGLGAASAVTSLSSTIVENSTMSFLDAEASQVTSACSDQGEADAEDVRYKRLRIRTSRLKNTRALQNIGRNVVARTMRVVTKGIFIWIDVADIVEESKHLQEGAKSELAEKLRKVVKLLEKKLERLIQTHEHL